MLTAHFLAPYLDFYPEILVFIWYNHKKCDEYLSHHLNINHSWQPVTYMFYYLMQNIARVMFYKKKTMYLKNCFFTISGTTPSDSSQTFGLKDIEIGCRYFQKLFTVSWGKVISELCRRCTGLLIGLSHVRHCLPDSIIRMLVAALVVLRIQWPVLPFSLW